MSTSKELQKAYEDGREAQRQADLAAVEEVKEAVSPKQQPQTWRLLNFVIRRIAEGGKE